MMSHPNVDLIRSFEDRFVAGDLDYVLSILTDDVTVHECASVPYPGDHRGKDAFLKLAEAFGSVWDIQAPLDLEIHPAGDEKVLVLVGLDVIAKPSGKPLRLKIAEIYTIRDGKIADVVVHYWDTHQIAEATNGITVLEGELP
jgi:ketosteroid isomerase-like protein